MSERLLRPGNAKSDPSSARAPRKQSRQKLGAKACEGKTSRPSQRGRLSSRHRCTRKGFTCFLLRPNRARADQAQTSNAQSVIPAPSSTTPTSCSERDHPERDTTRRNRVFAWLPSDDPRLETHADSARHLPQKPAVAAGEESRASQ